MSAEPSTPNNTQPILVTAEDLPVYCPGPKAPLWSMHPRVYIELAQSGTAACPYCSAVYQLQDER
ncbi:MAG TPA: zinc-finger domain-containing protein [Pusillimonas sp.]|uniref:zinc-finger domain-containing protein n=1 Tax=Pusillimonas sp. TaxID=3040095 RepID=UPI002C7377EA|nr:zinc-finger domain-containing protein [Pusillimonas sp.]HUH87171.1 zinc-finger domain-containing protein [Pusillimonas sp.]